MEILNNFNSISNIDRRLPERNNLFRSITPLPDFKFDKKTVTWWKEAITSAENEFNPDRNRLYKLYSEAELDPHIKAVTEQRKMRTTSKKFVLVDDNNETDIEATRLFLQPWFIDLMGFCLDAKYWGHSLVQLGNLVDCYFDHVKLIDRRFVRPEFHIVTQTPQQITGVDYTKPGIKEWNIECGRRDDLGLYKHISQIYLYKKYALGDWSQFVRQFGQPLKVGKTGSRDDEARNNMLLMFRDFSSSMGVVLDPDDEVEFVEASSASGQTAHEFLIRWCDDQISKAILGGTGSVDEKSFVGSAKIHDDTAGTFASSDQREIEYMVNGQLIPQMIKLGVTELTNKSFRFDSTEKLSSMDKIIIDEKINAMGFDVSEEYIEETYNTPVEKREVQPTLFNTMKNYYPE